MMLSREKNIFTPNILRAAKICPVNISFKVDFNLRLRILACVSVQMLVNVSAHA